MLDIHIKSGSDKVIATMIDSRGAPSALEGIINGKEIILWSKPSYNESKGMIEAHQMTGTITGSSAKGNGCRVQNTKVQEYRWEFIPK